MTGELGHWKMIKVLKSLLWKFKYLLKITNYAKQDNHLNQGSMCHLFCFRYKLFNIKHKKVDSTYHKWNTGNKLNIYNYTTADFFHETIITQNQYKKHILVFKYYLNNHVGVEYSL